MTRIITSLMILFILTTTGFAQDIISAKKIINPPDTPIGLFSPGVLVGKTLYVAGKGDHIPGGGHHATFREQARQCLENVRSTLKLAGMDMENIVESWVFLKDLNDYDVLNKLFFEYFPEHRPCRTTFQVGDLPGNSSIEITVIAHRDVAERKVIRPAEFPGLDRPYSPAILVENTLYVSGKGDIDEKGNRPPTFDEQVHLVMNNVGDILHAAGLDFKNVVWSNVYLTKYENLQRAKELYSTYFEQGKAPAGTVIFVDKLPRDCNIEVTCIAVTDRAKKEIISSDGVERVVGESPAVLADNTLYISGQNGNVKGKGIVGKDIEEQLHATFSNLKSVLGKAGMGLEDVVSSNVYLRDLAHFQRMNEIFKQYFSKNPPVRTTLQQHSGYEKNNELVKMSLIATKK